MELKDNKCLESEYKEIYKKLKYSKLPLKKRIELTKKKTEIKSTLIKRYSLLSLVNQDPAKLNTLYTLLIDDIEFSKFEIFFNSISNEDFRNAISNFAIDGIEFLTDPSLRNIDCNDDNYTVSFYSNKKLLSKKKFDKKTSISKIQKYRDNEEERLIKADKLLPIKLPFKPESGVNLINKGKYYSANWVEEGEQKHKLFSTSNSKTTAHKKAVTFRKKKEKEMTVKYMEELENYGLSKRVINFIVKTKLK